MSGIRRSALRPFRPPLLALPALILFASGGALAAEPCLDCHTAGRRGTSFAEDLSHSAHQGLPCDACHTDRGSVDLTKEPVHQGVDPNFRPGSDPCRQCHTEASRQYQLHGRLSAGSEDTPECADCHGDHDILPSAAKHSRTHPANLPATCGRCHQDIDLTTKYEILYAKAIEVYQSSVHGRATKGGIYVAATCNDCHSSSGTAHRILSPGHPESSINHFNIPKTCGRCHRSVEEDFWEGIHGKLVQRGQTQAPVCTNCHGEHGIISPRDPRSPVSPTRVAQDTCAPCHESARLNERYGVPSGRLRTFIDSYHGLKTKAGDTHVANCASCHGVHRILPSSDPTSTVHPSNLRHTCGECHPGITEQLAQTPIHGVSGGLRTPAADVVEKIYIVAIIVIIGLMVIHWLLDLGRHIHEVITAKPQLRRMRTHEVWQHTLLMVSFIVLAISGFALRFSDAWLTRFFFGWEGGFELRGTVHRVASVVFMITVAWHAIFLATSARGRQFFRDMMPERRDFRQFWQRILYNLGRRPQPPHFGRFSYVEKAEYWALVWGTVVMILTGLLLWFDNYVVQFLPTGVLDVSLVIHYWEAWLATLAILVWHLYSTIFSPSVYPMNPSWITGTMPESMYRHEHPEHVEAARQETEELIRRQIDMVTAPSPPPDGADEQQKETELRSK